MHSVLRKLCTTAMVAWLAPSALAQVPLQPAWFRQIGTPFEDVASSVAIDATGNIYVAGSTGGSLVGNYGGGRDAYLTKYDLSGNTAWTRQISMARDNPALSVSVDKIGNAYIAGYAESGID